MQEQKSFLGNLFIRIIVHFLYLLGLSVIIPVLFLFFFPEHLWAPIAYVKPVLYAAIVLVVLSALILYAYKQSLGKTFFSLGLMTLIPGIISLIFSIYNKDIVFGFIKSYVVQFEMIEPVIETYLTHSLPRVWALTIAYLLIGGIMIWLGIKYLKRESANAWYNQIMGR